MSSDFWIVPDLASSIVENLHIASSKDPKLYHCLPKKNNKLIGTENLDTCAYEVILYDWVLRRVDQ